MKRRDFLTTLTAASSATLLTGCSRTEPGPSSDRIGRTLPTRILGRTGERVSMLGIGGFHVGWTTEKDAEEVIEAAMAGGIRFFDTAESYQQGESERRYGKFLTPKYRHEVFLMTKSTAKDAKTAREHLEGSLSRMKTDVIDLWQIHSLGDPQDVDTRLDNGVLDVFLEAQASGRVRHIGFTGHSNPEAHLRMLERTTDTDPFATCQMPVNVIDPSRNSFVEQVTPVLQERNIALLAMKTLADGRFFAQKKRLDRIQWTTEDPAVPGRLSVRDALHFAWSQPISVLITGAENASLVREKVDLARAYEGMSETEQNNLITRAADLADGKVEYYKRANEA
jgi:aryl-alcohol dehydrogenase-like predicted oxidoreductase